MERRFIDYAGVRFYEDRIVLLDKETIELSVKRDKIREMLLLHGFQADRPLIQILLGGSLSIIGFLSLGSIIVWLLEGGRMLKWIVLMSGFLPLGVWIAYEGLKTGHFLMIYESRKRKIPFNRQATPEGLNEILNTVEAQFGYVIKR